MEARRRPSPSDARLARGYADEHDGASELQDAAGDRPGEEGALRRGALLPKDEALKRHAYASTHTLFTGRARKSSSAVVARQRSWGMVITGALVAFVYVASYGLGQQVPLLPASALPPGCSGSACTMRACGRAGVRAACLPRRRAPRAAPRTPLHFSAGRDAADLLRRGPPFRRSRRTTAACTQTASFRRLLDTAQKGSISGERTCSESTTTKQSCMRCTSRQRKAPRRPQHKRPSMRRRPRVPSAL